MTGRHRAEAAPARRALTALGTLLLPVACAGCGEPDVAVCRRCRWALAGPATRAGTARGVPVLAVVPYAGAARRLLLAWKDDGRHDVAPVVRAAVARSLRAASASPTGSPAGADATAVVVVVVPVPSSAAACRRRGGDVLARVTQDAVAGLRAGGRPVAVARVLRPCRRVADQSGLTAEQRWRNLDGALALTRGADLAGRSVVLVDDVVTTGATLGEGVRVLRAAGATVVAAAVVAATPLRAGSGHPLRAGSGHGSPFSFAVVPSPSATTVPSWQVAQVAQVPRTGGDASLPHSVPMTASR